MFFTPTQKTKAPRVVFYIRSQSVDAFLVTATDTDRYEIAFHTRIELSYQKEIDLERYRKNMLAALMDAAMQTSANAIAPYIAAHHHALSPVATIIISAPWHQPFIRSIQIHNEKPFTLSKKMMHDALVKECEAQKGELTKIVGEKVEMVSPAIECLSANGYRTDSPWGFVMNDATAMLLGTVIGVETKRAIDEVVEKVVQAKPTIHSSMALLSRALSQFAKPPKRFLLVEGHGEITEITRIENGTIVDRATTPVGTHTLVRAIQKDVATPLAEVLSRIALMKTGDATISPTQTAQYTDARVVWQTGFSEALQKIATRTILPQDIILACDSEWVGWFTESITTTPLVVSTIEHGVQVTLVTEHLSKGHPQFLHTTDYAVQMAMAAGDSGGSNENDLLAHY